MTSISTTLLRHAEIEFQEPPAALRRHVGCFWVITGASGALIRAVPDGTTAISALLQHRQSFGWSLRGPLLRPYDRRFAAPSILVGVRLHPGVAFMLSQIPAHRMVNRRIDLVRVDAFRDLVSAPAATPAEAVEALRRFLLARLQGADLPAVIAAAIDTINRYGGRLRVTNVAARCDVSSRHLHRLMRRWMGVGPKRYAAIVRFQAALTGIERVPHRPAARLASAMGYFDQSHLTGDLGRLAGATPGQLATGSVSELSKTRCEDAP